MTATSTTPEARKDQDQDPRPAYANAYYHVGIEAVVVLSGHTILLLTREQGRIKVRKSGSDTIWLMDEYLGDRIYQAKAMAGRMVTELEWHESSADRYNLLVAAFDALLKMPGDFHDQCVKLGEDDQMNEPDEPAVKARKALQAEGVDVIDEATAENLIRAAFQGDVTTDVSGRVKLKETPPPTPSTTIVCEVPLSDQEGYRAPPDPFRFRIDALTNRISFSRTDPEDGEEIAGTMPYSNVTPRNLAYWLLNRSGISTHYAWTEEVENAIKFALSNLHPDQPWVLEGEAILAPAEGHVRSKQLGDTQTREGLAEALNGHITRDGYYAVLLAVFDDAEQAEGIPDAERMNLLEALRVAMTAAHKAEIASAR
jgi:hypothetical protein